MNEEHKITRGPIGQDGLKHVRVVKCSCGWKTVEIWEKVHIYFTGPNSPLTIKEK